MGFERRNTGRGSEGMTAKHSGEEKRARRERGRIVGKEESITRFQVLLLLFYDSF